MECGVVTEASEGCYPAWHFRKHNPACVSILSLGRHSLFLEFLPLGISPISCSFFAHTMVGDVRSLVYRLQVPYWEYWMGSLVADLLYVKRPRLLARAHD